jgi:hypothetical protein
VPLGERPGGGQLGVARGGLGGGRVGACGGVGQPGRRGGAHRGDPGRDGGAATAADQFGGKPLGDVDVGHLRHPCKQRAEP